MRSSKIRRAMVVVSMAALLIATPSTSQACCLFDWLFPCHQTAATTYAPPFTPPAIAAANPCTTQTCGYTPVTTYRWAFSPIARTSYQPVTTVDPCTGCARTAYQPVMSRTLLPWLHREAVTNYQLTCAPTAAAPCSPCAAPACAPCGAPTCGSCGAPGISTIAPMTTTVPSGCPSCAGAAAPGPGAAVAPSLDSGYSTPSTFAPGPAPGTAMPGPAPQPVPDTRLRVTPTPDANPPLPGPVTVNPTGAATPAASSQPRLLVPEGRTTVRPVSPARSDNGFRTVSWTESKDDAEQPLDVSGWHAAK